MAKTGLATLKYIRTRISGKLATTVKLQRIGNSIRATIPKEVVESLDLKPGEEMVIDAVDDAVLLKKRMTKDLADLYGVLGRAKGRIQHWPTPEQIKSIWE
jgi:AbrB family looped-hinge helix DNA binding protein